MTGYRHSTVPRANLLARRIDLLDAERGKYFRIVARVVADGKDIGQALIDRGMAVEYDGGKKTKDWCGT